MHKRSNDRLPSAFLQSPAPYDFTDKIVLVTGGAGGVGTVLVERLARAGAHVVINCFHSYERAKALSARLIEEGCSTEVARASVAKQDAAAQMVAKIVADHGRIDVVINNAAGGKFVSFDALTEELLDRTFATNVKGALWVAKAAAPHMPPQSKIVNVSSIGAVGVPDNYLAVGVSKAGLEALTRYLAVELAPQGITVNTASCALIDNEVGRLFPGADSMFAESIRATPLGRIATPEDLAEVAIFLASPGSGWITGQCLLADGGLSLLNTALSPTKSSPAATGPTTPAPTTAAPAAPAAAAPPAIPAPVPAPAAVPVPTPVRTAEPASVPDDALAIVGMGIAVPGASSPEEYWQQLTHGGEFFIEAPADRWPVDHFYDPAHNAADKSYQRRSGFITDFTPHPSLAAELTAGSGRDWDYTTVWLRHSLYQALDGVRTAADSRFAFCVGYTPDGSQHLQEALVYKSALSATESAGLDATATTAVSEALGARYWRGAGSAREFLPHRAVAAAAEGILPVGTANHVVDTACSSSLYAIDAGARELLAGNADVAVCGGSFALAASGSVLFSKLNGLSTSGVVSSLDAAADGVLFCDGAGIVVLKRLADALRDGDQILGQLSGVGLSADGKGKAIYAPSSAGQALAVRRCFERSELQVADVDWIIAHATGTPAGDLAEFTGLAEAYRADHPVQVTSNKSLIGHAGWAAGVASVINALLGLRHGQIPAQYRYVDAPQDFHLDQTNLEIPSSAISWPQRDTVRTVAVSGFGFGGTNAHLLISDYQPTQPLSSGYGAAQPDDLVVVGWSAQLPGTDDATDVVALVGEDAAWGGFGDVYPAPGFPRLKMPPGTVRTTDRTQVSIVEAMQRLPKDVFDFCHERRARAGVVVGHLGMTRNALLFGLRAHVDDLSATLAAVPGGPAVADVFAERARSLAAAPTEDSFPGEMPNVIAARLSNYFDLKGLNITVDHGRASLYEALRVAQSYLTFDDIDLAVVATSDGNTDPAWLELVAEATGTAPEGVREGTFLFVTTKRSTAVEAGLPILATLSTPTATANPTANLSSEAGTSVPAVADPLDAFGNAGSRELAAFLIAADRPATDLALRPDQASAPVRIAVTRGGRTVSADTPPTPQPSQPSQPNQPTHDPALDLPVDPGNLRHLFGLANTDSLPVPAPTSPNDAAIRLDPTTDLAAVQASIGEPPTDLRFLIDLGPEPAPADLPTAAIRWAAVSDLVFQVTQRWARLDRPSSWGLVLTGATDAGWTPHPAVGLFTGFAKSLRLELSEIPVRSLVTAATDPALAYAELAAEFDQASALPVVYRDGTRRASIAVHRAPALRPGLALQTDDLIVAAGGARGVAAALLTAAAERYRCRIALIGTLDLATVPAAVLAQSDQEFAASKPGYIRQRISGSAAVSVADANREYVRLGQARETDAGLRRLRELCGQDRVHYVRADLRDPVATRAAIDEIERTLGPTAVLLNVAGINRASSVTDKTLADFTAVRDLKLACHVGLAAAYAGRRPGRWYNFGSFVGFTGQRGETDYGAGNDFLNTSAAAAHARGEHEVTLGWGLWAEVGLGASPIMRSFLVRSAQYTSMPTTEGIQHFLSELGQPTQAPWTVYFGGPEEKAMELAVPGFLAQSAGRELSAPLAHPAPRPVVRAAAETGRAPRSLRYLDRFDQISADELIGHYTFDLERDGYLRHHLVNGYPTLPGTFVPELAAQAALQLRPDLVPVGINDLRLSAFLRVYGDRPAAKRLHARVVSEDRAGALVEVRILTDVTAPNGQVLTRDKEHFRATVELGHAAVQPPRWEHWADFGTKALRDPYHVPNDAVLLTDEFVSTTATRLHPWGRQATLALDRPGIERWFGDLHVPSVLLDGLARVAVLQDRDGWTPIAVPRGMRRIDLYGGFTDATLAAAGTAVQLYSMPATIDLEDPTLTNRSLAATADGRVVLQIHDMTGLVLGYINQRSGQFVARDAFQRQQLKEA